MTTVLLGAGYAFSSLVMESLLRLSGVNVRGLDVDLSERVRFDLYEERSSSRNVKVAGFHLRFRNRDDRLVIESLRIDEVAFEDLSRPTVDLRAVVEKLRTDSPAARRPIVVEDLAIGRIFLTLSSTSAPLELRNLKVRGLEISPSGTKLASAGVESPFLSLTDGDVLRGRLTLSPAVFADLAREIHWSFAIPKSRLALEKTQIAALRAIVEAQSQP